MTSRSTHDTRWGIAFIALVGIVLWACNPKPKVTDKDVIIIDDVQLAEMLSGEAEVLIIDARPAYRYRLGHLPGAVNIPLPEIDHTDPRFVEGLQVVVYGDGPHNTLSHAAAKKLLASGKLFVSDFRGGLELWREAGREVETGYR